MRFSWTGLILAPLLAPMLLSAAVLSLQDDNVPLMFLILLVPSCILSYGTTIFLFLPALYLISLRWPLSGWKACLLGLMLGTLMIVPLMAFFWKSSGVDSGPPTESFLAFFLRWTADPLTAIYPLSGLVTAGLYWWLATRRRHATP